MEPINKDLLKVIRERLIQTFNQEIEHYEQDNLFIKHDGLFANAYDFKLNVSETTADGDAYPLTDKSFVKTREISGSKKMARIAISPTTLEGIASSPLNLRVFCKTLIERGINEFDIDMKQLKIGPSLMSIRAVRATEEIVSYVDGAYQFWVQSDLVYMDGK